MGGFYVGRFETTGISAIPEVKRAKTNLSNENWFTMYINMKKITNNNSVSTGIIWGCLFDEILQWLVDTNTLTQVDVCIATNWGNHTESEFEYDENKIKKANECRWIPSGSSEHNNVNNIYDLSGNLWEATMESVTTSYNITERVYRGGAYDSISMTGNWQTIDQRHRTSFIPWVSNTRWSGLTARAFMCIN